MGRPSQFLLCAIVCLFVDSARAVPVPVFGGPTYSPQSGNGYRAIEPNYPGPLVGTGFAIGTTNLYSAGSQTSQRAFRFDQAGWRELPNTGSGTTSTAANAMNATGTIVGYANWHGGNSFVETPVRWENGGTVVVPLDTLPNPDGTVSGSAVAINSGGTAIGTTFTDQGGNFGWHPVRWNAGGHALTELATLGTASNGITVQAFPAAINDAGTIAGYSNKYVNNVSVGSRAVRWDAGGTAVTQLDDFGPGSDGETGSSQAKSINRSGTIVGGSNEHVNSNWNLPFAVRWDPGGTAMTVLETLPKRSDVCTCQRFMHQR